MLELDIINNYITNGLITFQSHPSLPLKIYNYTRDCQYNNNWDDITLMCRGLVLNDKGNIIARPFKKFFNYQEQKHKSTTNFDVYTKEDGCLGILFYYKDQWIISSRGSFTSIMSQKAFKLLNEKYKKYINLPKDRTYLFEIICEECKIVVDYQKNEKLILLGCIDTLSGYEYNIHDEEFHKYELDIVTKHHGILDYKTLLNQNIPNFEGYVIRFDNGDRCKIKMDEYVRLHSLVTGISNLDIWRSLRDNVNIFDSVSDIPDELDGWIKKTLCELKDEYTSFYERANTLLSEYIKNVGGQIIDKHSFVSWVNDQPIELRPVIFNIFNKKDSSDYIWRNIRPTFNKPFFEGKGLL